MFDDDLGLFMYSDDDLGVFMYNVWVKGRGVTHHCFQLCEELYIQGEIFPFAYPGIFLVIGTQLEDDLELEWQEAK